MTRFAAYDAQNHVQTELTDCSLAVSPPDARVRARRRGDMQEKAEQGTKALDKSTELQDAAV